jgi:hypothetical protein
MINVKLKMLFWKFGQLNTKSYLFLYELLKLNKVLKDFYFLQSFDSSLLTDKQHISNAFETHLSSSIKFMSSITWK